MTRLHTLIHIFAFNGLSENQCVICIIAWACVFAVFVVRTGVGL